LVEEFDLAGCPVYFDLVGKSRETDRPPPRGDRAETAED
jgi:hypothetical protein